MPTMQRVAAYQPWKRSRIGLLLLTLIALVPVGGCFSFKQTGDPPAPPPVSLTYTIPVTVESRFREDLTVFVVHDGLASRLTRIGSSTTSKFTIPAHMIGSLGEITLIAEGIGGRDGSSRLTTGRLRVLPGQGLLWTIETRLTNSFAQVVPMEAIRPDSIRTDSI